MSGYAFPFIHIRFSWIGLIQIKRKLYTKQLSSDVRYPN